MRPIDADALKDKFPNARADVFENCRNCTCLDNEQINQIIDSAPTIGGWISVKENLPKVSGHYLVSCVNNKTGHRWQVSVNAEWLTSRREWYLETGNCLASADGITVTHYMPLPEPPKENEDE